MPIAKRRQRPSSILFDGRRPAGVMLLMSLDGKKVVLTGGSGGIGRHLAAHFVGAGANLAVLSRNRREPDGSRHLQADLSTFEGIAAAQIIVAREEPDILVNLAGVQYFGLIEDQPLDGLSKSYLINLVAPVGLCQACLPAMKRRNFGQIVNVGSVFGSIPFAHFAAYSSAKAGLKAFSEALRRELVDTDVSVTHVSPRAARTDFITPDIQKYAQLTRMTIDDPVTVAGKIFLAIKHRRKEVCIGVPERIFSRLNAIVPRLVDAAVARNDRRSKQLFSVSVPQRRA
jgi:short-subunit dehydrogenase